MKQTYLYIWLLLVMPFLLTNCSSDDNSTDNNPPVDLITPPTPQAFNELRQTALADLVQEFVIPIDDSGFVSFTSEKGVEVVVTVSFWCGAELEGNVQVEFIELFDKASLLTTNIATMGRNTNGGLEMLVTGGAFYIDVTQNGESITTTCGVTMSVPTSLTQGADYDMILWHGDFDENGNLVWEEAEGEAGQEGQISISDDIYSFWTSQFGWTNIDRFYSDPRPKTTILVDVPNGYNNSNSAVYLSYNGELGLARLDTYDEETGHFSEHYGLIPVGLECNVIFISEYEGEWVYAIKPVTIVEDDIIEIPMADLNTATQSQLMSLIDALP